MESADVSANKITSDSGLFVFYAMKTKKSISKQENAFVKTHFTKMNKEEFA